MSLRTLSFSNHRDVACRISCRFGLFQTWSLDVFSGKANTSVCELNSSTATLPIACLTPYTNKWAIKARVTSKKNVRTWSNARGEGKLFSFDVLDSSGEIRITAFKEQCDKFYDLIEVNLPYSGFGMKFGMKIIFEMRPQVSGPKDGSCS